jgi:hypothetical protein
MPTFEMTTQSIFDRGPSWPDGPGDGAQLAFYADAGPGAGVDTGTPGTPVLTLRRRPDAAWEPIEWQAGGPINYVVLEDGGRRTEGSVPGTLLVLRDHPASVDVDERGNGRLVSRAAVSGVISQKR